MKKLLATLYIVVMVVMAIATFGVRIDGRLIYDQWWFTVLWGLLAAAAVAWLLKRRVRRLSVVLLHLSLLVILLGALLTHLTARQGVITLQPGETTDRYIADETMRERQLPFEVKLDSFRVVYYEGSEAAADYESHLTLIDGDKRRQVVVSMNNICTHRSVRLYQSSFDETTGGTILAMNSDPWGIPVTYVGYALLFAMLIWMLFDPKGSYRQVLRSPYLKRGALVLALLFTAGGRLAAAPTTLPRATADKMGRLLILYNDRICPMQTYAMDFTRQLCGRAHYGDFTAEQVLAGFIFYADEWNNEPLIRVKGSQLKSRLQLPDRASVNSFFADDYILGPLVNDYYHGHQQDKFYKEAAQMDERLMLVMELEHGRPLKLFPYTLQGRTMWYSPVEDSIPEAIPAENRLFMGSFFQLLYESLVSGDTRQADHYLDKLLAYQHKYAGESVPSDTKMTAERIYNAVPFATILFMVCLTMGFLTLGLFIFQMVRGRPLSRWLMRSAYGVLTLSFLALTFCEALRWIIRGTIPMSNGYETMLLMAWFIQLLTLCLYRRFRILLTFGFLLSGFFLLVSHISQMSPQIGHLMPVLRSPLLTIHVSIIMMSFALLSLTFIIAVTALLQHVAGGKRNDQRRRETGIALMQLCRVFLYPALTTLGIGIFVGAIWANISWGTYWSWDPKETWALITFMVYAVAVHVQSLPRLARPLPYHLFMLLAFLTILMTYFGVNYFLGGMHSYA